MKRNVKRRARRASISGVEKLVGGGLAHIAYLLGLCGFSADDINRFKQTEVLPSASASNSQRFAKTAPHFLVCAHEILTQIRRCRRTWTTKKWRAFGEAAMELGIVRGGAFVSASAAWDRRKHGRKRFAPETQKTERFKDTALQIAKKMAPPLRKKEVWHAALSALPEKDHIAYNTFTEHFLLVAGRLPNNRTT